MNFEYNKSSLCGKYKYNFKFDSRDLNRVYITTYRDGRFSCCGPSTIMGGKIIGWKNSWLYLTEDVIQLSDDAIKFIEQVERLKAFS